MEERRKCQDIDLGQVERVVVIRLDEIGDVVMTTPLLRELRHTLPGALITLVVKPEVCNLVEMCPYVDKVLTFNPNVSGRFARLQRRVSALWFARRQLHRYGFDLAIVPRWDTDYNGASSIAYSSGARLRVGYSESVSEWKMRSNKGYDRLFTHVIHSGALRHEVERGLDVLRFLGGTVGDDQPELWLNLEDDAYADAVLDNHNVEPEDVVVAFGASPGGSPLKQWPVENFVQLGLRFVRELGARILLIGGPKDRRTGAELHNGVGPAVINAVGTTTLRQSAALIRRCAMFVGNDTGAAHISAAVETPVVALFGPSCPHRFSPFGGDHAVIWAHPRCGPCSQSGHQDSCRECVFPRPACMLDISVDHVVEVIRRHQEAKVRGSASDSGTLKATLVEFANARALASKSARAAAP